MADKSKDTFVSQPPYHRPISDPSKDGRCSVAWQQWFDSLRVRIGGTYAKSSTSIEDSNVANASTIDELKKSLTVIDDNVKTISTTVDENNRDIVTLKNNQDTDHESITTSAQKISTLENDNNTNKQNIETNKTNIDNINNNLSNLNKVEVVSVLPTSADYTSKFVQYNNLLYYNLNGVWKKVTLTD